MANRKQMYSLPDYKSTTDNIDDYIDAWQQLATPVEQALGVTLAGFDPDFVFRKGSPQMASYTSVSLPVWFVRDLAQSLSLRNSSQ